MGYPDMMRDIMEQARREAIANRRKALEHRSIIDPVTGLYSREYFNLRLDQEMDRSRLHGNRLSLLIIRAGFSPWQDRKNEEQVGEKVLAVIAGVIDDCLKDTIGLAFHCDQGKFVVIMPEADGREAERIADRIRERIIGKEAPGVPLHAGVAQFKDHESIDEFIREGDDALNADR